KTAYRRLASEYQPDKHAGVAESLKPVINFERTRRVASASQKPTNDSPPWCLPGARNHEPVVGSAQPKRMIVRRPTFVVGARSPAWLGGVLRPPAGFLPSRLPRRARSRYSPDRQTRVLLFHPPHPEWPWPTRRSALGPARWLG